MNNFDLKKFLTENKLTSNSKLLSERRGFISPFDLNPDSLGADKYGEFIEDAEWKDGTPLTDDELELLNNYPNMHTYMSYHRDQGIDDPWEYFVMDYKHQDDEMRKEKPEDFHTQKKASESSDPRFDDIAMAHSNTDPNTPPGATPGTPPKSNSKLQKENTPGFDRFADAAEDIVPLDDPRHDKFLDAIHKALIDGDISGDPNEPSSYYNQALALARKLGYAD